MVCPPAYPLPLKFTEIGLAGPAETQTVAGGSFHLDVGRADDRRRFCDPLFDERGERVLHRRFVSSGMSQPRSKQALAHGSSSSALSSEFGKEIQGLASVSLRLKTRRSRATLEIGQVSFFFGRRHYLARAGMRFGGA